MFILGHRNPFGRTEDIMRVLVSKPFLALTLAALGSSACDEEFVFNTRGVLDAKCCADIPVGERVANKVDFGQVQTGIVATKELVIRNSGDALLTVQKFEF